MKRSLWNLFRSHSQHDPWIRKMCNCIAQGQIWVCTVTQKVTFQSPASSLQWSSRSQACTRCTEMPSCQPSCCEESAQRHSIAASFTLPPLAHISAAHWGNSPHLQRHWSKKIQPSALCVCISKKWDICMPLDYPYSLCYQFLTHYSLKPEQKSWHSLLSQELLLHWMSQKRMGWGGEEMIIYRVQNGAAPQLVFPPANRVYTSQV